LSKSKTKVIKLDQINIWL